MGRRIYKLFSDMTSRERSPVEDVISLQRKINSLESQVEKLRKEKSNIAEKVIWYLRKTKYDGIEKDNTILYVAQMGGGVPSFWQVFMSVRNKLAHKDVVILETAYQKLSSEREKHDTLIVKAGG